MIKLIEHVGHPELCAQIVGQFAFMKAMSRPEDNCFFALQDLSLDEIYNKADAYFIDFTTIEEIIESDKCNLTEKLSLFLQEWKGITDVTAIQQNIHYNLKRMES